VGIRGKLVVIALVLVFVFALGRGQGRHVRGDVDDDAGRLTQRVFDRRLEPSARVQHHVGRRDRLDVVGSELEVVRLDPRRGELHDRDAVAAHLSSRLGDRIEARNHGRPPVVHRGRVVAARGSEQGDQ
jgi:hypothetical protein